jgi:hypothetical protein
MRPVITVPETHNLLRAYALMLQHNLFCTFVAFVVKKNDYPKPIQKMPRNYFEEIH